MIDSNDSNNESDSDIEPIETTKTTPEEVEEELDFATEIVVEDGDVITVDRLHEILRDEYDMEITEEDGTTHYGKPPDEVLSAFSTIKASVRKGIPPHELGITAERRNKFGECVTGQFNKQLENSNETGEDPFPLEASIPTENNTTDE